MYNFVGDNILPIHPEFLFDERLVVISSPTEHGESRDGLGYLCPDFQCWDLSAAGSNIRNQAWNSHELLRRLGRIAFAQAKPSRKRYTPLVQA